MNKAEQIEELEAQLSAIQAQIDEMKNVEEEWPKVGDKVWTLGLEGTTIFSNFTGTVMWKHRLATGSLHRTEAEASAYRDWLTSPRTQARRMVETCDGFDVKGEALIFYQKGNLSIMHASEYDGGLQFNSDHQAQAAIDKLGEETIKLALGVE